MNGNLGSNTSQNKPGTERHMSNIFCNKVHWEGDKRWESRALKVGGIVKVKKEGENNHFNVQLYVKVYLFISYC